MNPQYQIKEHTPDPSLEPVTTFPDFTDHMGVLGFFRDNRNRLTQTQIDNLVAIYEQLQAYPLKIEATSHNARRSAAEGVLIQGWKDACSATTDEGERTRRMAQVAAGVLGEDSTFRCRRVCDAYRDHGMKATHRAVLQLSKDGVSTEDAFKFLLHRAKTQAEDSKQQPIANRQPQGDTNITRLSDHITR